MGWLVVRQGSVHCSPFYFTLLEGFQTSAASLSCTESSVKQFYQLFFMSAMEDVQQPVTLWTTVKCHSSVTGVLFHTTLCFLYTLRTDFFLEGHSAAPSSQLHPMCFAGIISLTCLIGTQLTELGCFPRGSSATTVMRF